jgi:predicted dehydrogenase/threonine dehydrogenase-like Zn-dependent dehydrogenase
MKQVVLKPSTGETSVEQVPLPSLGPGGLLVQTAASLVSVGTERMVADFAQKSILGKARSRPDLVRQTLDKVQREGILTTLDAVRNRLGQPMALGYSCAGTVMDVGAGVSEFEIGDRVACAGGGYAVHAEVVSVPKNLAVKLPDNVDFESAAFTTLGAIALQGIRLAEVKLGEVVAVIGLGLLGQLAVQMLKVAGCTVVGMDIQPQRAELAHKLGTDAVATAPDELSAICHQLSAGNGADAVLITADTKSNQPVEVAGEIARDKGIVVAVGAVGMAIPRNIYYEKELDFRISRSYGPGRYDPEYEEKGRDYPYAYVRWTEQRNMEAFVQLLAQDKVGVRPLITHRFPIADALEAYELITRKTGEPFLGVLLTYPGTPDLSRKAVLHPGSGRATGEAGGRDVATVVDRVRVGVIGAGNFANATLLPAIKRVPGVELIGIASRGGLSARSTASRFGFAYCASDAQEIFNDPAVNTVAILTRHHLHANQVVAALNAGKHVFVEKPLCLTEEELQVIISTRQDALKSAGSEGGHFSSPVSSSSRFLMVGFNRRFAPFVVELKQHLQRVQEPLMLHCRVNAGYIPPDHWTQDPAQGGGRLMGEACHFIDLLIYLAGSVPQRVTSHALPDSGRYSRDNLLITLEFANGTLGTVTYVANGNKGFGKESLEAFGGGLSARLEDYRVLLICHGSKRVRRVSRLRQDKGHRAEWQALAAYLTGKGPAPMSFEEIRCSTEAAFAAQHSLQSGAPVSLGGEQR